jgi:hypothetical protein
MPSLCCILRINGPRTCGSIVFWRPPSLPAIDFVTNLMRRGWKRTPSPAPTRPHLRQAGGADVRSPDDVGCSACRGFARGDFDFACWILLCCVHLFCAPMPFIGVAGGRGSRLSAATNKNRRAAPTSLPQAVALVLRSRYGEPKGRYRRSNWPFYFHSTAAQRSVHLSKRGISSRMMPKARGKESCIGVCATPNRS